MAITLGETTNIVYAAMPFGTPQNGTNWYNAGKLLYGSNLSTYASFLQFDIGDAGRKKTTKVMLYQYIYEVRNIFNEPNPSGDISINIRPFSLNDADVFPGNVSGLAYYGQPVTAKAGNTDGRWLAIDITEAFDAFRAQNNRVCLAITALGDYIITFIGSGGANKPYLEFTTDILPPLAPSNLLPAITQNPRAPITLSWWHTPNPGLAADDPQTASQLTVWQDGAARTVYDIPGTENSLTLPADTFTAYDPVYFQARTQTQYNGWGPEAEARFDLGATPPLAPTLVYPVNIAVSGINGVLLEWRYNSPYDTTPSGFGVRYRFNGGDWENRATAGQISIMTGPIEIQSKAEWQVMAYGALGDAGPWSEIGTFYTIGVPEAPTIVDVSNSNRPTIYFSAVNLLSWEIEITQDGVDVYNTGNQPFLNEFSYCVDRLLPNGAYIAKMRIVNEFGFYSGWGLRPFIINTTPPPKPKLKLVDNPDLFMRLHMENGGNLTYIYRSEFRRGDYLRIGKTTEPVFDDYTAAPKQRYDYFVRVVDNNFAYADSDVETGGLSFERTVLAECGAPSAAAELVWQINAKPQKDRSQSFEKSLTQFIGREKPVLQIGRHSQKSIQLSFYCGFRERERLEELARSKKTLILRDWRLGTVYGTINGELSDKPAPVSKGCAVSFVFTETDFEREVEL